MPERGVGYPGDHISLAWAAVTVTIGLSLLLLSALGFVVSGAASLAPLVPGFIGAALTVIAIVEPLDRAPTRLAVAVAVTFAASGVVSAVWPLLDLVGLRRGPHQHSTWSAAAHVAAVPVLVGYIVSTHRLHQRAMANGTGAPTA